MQGQNIVDGIFQANSVSETQRYIRKSESLLQSNQQKLFVNFKTNASRWLDLGHQIQAIYGLSVKCISSYDVSRDSSPLNSSSFSHSTKHSSNINTLVSDSIFEYLNYLVLLPDLIFQRSSKGTFVDAAFYYRAGVLLLDFIESKLEKFISENAENTINRNYGYFCRFAKKNVEESSLLVIKQIEKFWRTLNYSSDAKTVQDSFSALRLLESRFYKFDDKSLLTFWTSSILSLKDTLNRSDFSAKSINRFLKGVFDNIKIVDDVLLFFETDSFLEGRTVKVSEIFNSMSKEMSLNLDIFPDSFLQSHLWTNSLLNIVPSKDASDLMLEKIFQNTEEVLITLQEMIIKHDRKVKSGTSNFSWNEFRSLFLTSSSSFRSKKIISCLTKLFDSLDYRSSELSFESMNQWIINQCTDCFIKINEKAVDYGNLSKKGPKHWSFETESLGAIISSLNVITEKANEYLQIYPLYSYRILTTLLQNSRNFVNLDANQNPQETFVNRPMKKIGFINSLLCYFETIHILLGKHLSSENEIDNLAPEIECCQEKLINILDASIDIYIGKMVNLCPCPLDKNEDSFKIIFKITQKLNELDIIAPSLLDSVGRSFKERILKLSSEDFRKIVDDEIEKYSNH